MDTGGGGGEQAIEKLLLDTVPALVGYWDRDERCHFANPAYAQMFGLEPAQVLNMTVREVLGDELYAQSVPHLEAVFAGHEQHFDRVLVDEHGRARHTEVSYVPHWVDGQVVGLVLLMTDVTEKVQSANEAARSSALHRALARSLPDSIVVAVDERLVVTLADGPARQLFGLGEVDIVGRHLAEAVPQLEAPLRERWQAVISGTYVTWDQVVSGRTLAMRAAPLVDADTAPSVLGAVVVGTDVTVERRRQHTAEALQRITAAGIAGADLAAVCAVVAAEARRSFNAPIAAVGRLAAGGIETVAADPATPSAAFGADDLGQVIEAAGPVLRPAVDATATDGATGVRCRAVAPITVQGELWGVVSVGLLREPRDAAALLASIAAFADVVGLVTTAAATWERLESDASTDHLTGLPNRRSFDDRLRELVASSGRGHSPLSLVLFDLDSFKEVNDTSGHPAGDALLQEVAAAASRVKRDDEMLARTGGDEFALVLSGDHGAAVTVADRLREALGQLPAPASFGVATLEAGGDARSLVAAADADLYRAKRARADGDR